MDLNDIYVCSVITENCAERTSRQEHFSYQTEFMAHTHAECVKSRIRRFVTNVSIMMVKVFTASQTL